MSSSPSTFDASQPMTKRADPVTTSAPRYHVTVGAGFALQRHFIVIRVPDSFGTMRGFSTNDGAKPFASSPPGIGRVNGTQV